MFQSGIHRWNLLDSPLETGEHRFDLFSTHPSHWADLDHLPSRVTAVCPNAELEGGSVGFGVFMEELRELGSMAQANKQDPSGLGVEGAGATWRAPRANIPATRVRRRTLATTSCEVRSRGLSMFNRPSIHRGFLAGIELTQELRNFRSMLQ